jgi:hypothetical protein
VYGIWIRALVHILVVLHYSARVNVRKELSGCPEYCLDKRYHVVPFVWYASAREAGASDTLVRTRNRSPSVTALTE